MSLPQEQPLYKGVAVGYARVSTVDQESGISLDAQEQAIGQYCLTNGLQLLRVVKEVFSGTKLLRDKLDREIMPLVKGRQITHIVCYDQDRWARNEYARLKWEKEVLEPHGVELVITNEGHFDSPHDRDLVRGLKGNVAEHFAQQVKVKVTQAMTFKANAREYCGGNVPYGYQPEEVDRRLSRHGKVKVIRKYFPHPFESKVVRFIKELYGWGGSDIFPLPEKYQGLGSYGSTVITEILNDLNVRKRKGKPFDTAFVKKLIHDSCNYHIGTFSYKKTYGDKDERRRRGGTYRPAHEVIEIPRAFDAIVPEELQLLCQKKITEAGVRAKRSSRFTVQRTEYLGSGLFHCSLCGGILLGRTRAADSRHKVPELRYMCSNRYNKAGCTSPMIKANLLHRGLDELMQLFLGNPDHVNAIVNHTVKILKDRRQEKPANLTSLKEQLQRIVHQKENLINNLKEAPDLGRILKDDLIALDQQQRTMEEALARMEKEQLSPRNENLEDKVRKACRDILKVWETASLKEKNLLLKALIKRAVVDTDAKEVVYSLAIPLEKLVGSCRGSGGTGSDGGCTEALAEVHGNRTHPPACGRCTGFEDQETHQAPWHFRFHNV